MTRKVANRDVPTVVASGHDADGYGSLSGRGTHFTGTTERLIMGTTKPPVIERIPADIHVQAQALGLVAETYTEEVAGHGVTGRVAWAITFLAPPTQRTDYTADVRVRYGSAITADLAHTQMRDALDELEAVHDAQQS